MSDYKNCEVGERYANYVCKFLSEDTFVSVDEMTNMISGDKVGFRVSFKKAKKIVLLNYCPYCGAKVLNIKNFEVAR